MAREARIVLPGVPHHVTQRGNYQQDVFFCDEDRRVYLRYLRDSALRYGLEVGAFCLMTNHVHLVVTPRTQTSLSKALGRTHLMYAQHVHQAHGRLGHLWQARFYSCPLDEARAHNAMIYVELNPVRAKIVRAPWRYPWSSAAAHCGMGGDPSRLLDCAAWFERMPPTRWKATLRSGLESDEVGESLRQHTRAGRPLGDEPFLRALENSLQKRVRARGRGRPTGSKDSYPRARRNRTES